jgi:ribosome-associated toxin RatA of RatAB toxin-antitoxin module
MPLYEGRHAAVVAADPQAVFAVLTSYERLHEWQGPLERATVLSRDHAGRGLEVEYLVDVRVRTVRYVLRHSYVEPNVIGSDYVEGDFRAFEGAWRLDPSGAGETTAQLRLKIDPGLPVPGMVQRMLQQRVLKGSVDDLRRRVADFGYV